MLKEIRESADAQPLSVRWQRMFDIYLTCQLHVIHPFGYGADQQGIQSFQMNVAQVTQSLPPDSEEAKDLLEAQKENWELLLQRAFGVRDTDASAVPVEACRGIASDVARIITSPEFTQRIEAEVKGVADPAAKQQALMQLVVDAHFDVLPNHGLEGENGYVRAQASMMRYTGDAQIMQSMQTAMMHVQQAAGV